MKTTKSSNGTTRVSGCCDSAALGINSVPGHRDGSQGFAGEWPMGQAVPDTWNSARPTLEQQLAQLEANQKAILAALKELADKQASEAEEKAARRRAQKSLTGGDAGYMGTLPHGHLNAIAGNLWDTMFNPGQH